MKDNSPKDGRWCFAAQRSLGETHEVYRCRRRIFAGTPSELTLKIALQCRFFQVCTCGYEGCNLRNPFADAVQIGLEVRGQHIAVTTSGIELTGSRRLPCIVRNEVLGNCIWICEGLVIVFLTETLPPTAVAGERARQGEATRERLRKSSRRISLQRNIWIR